MYFRNDLPYLFTLNIFKTILTVCSSDSIPFFNHSDCIWRTLQTLTFLITKLASTFPSILGSNIRRRILLIWDGSLKSSKCPSDITEYLLADSKGRGVDSCDYEAIFVYFEHHEIDRQTCCLVIPCYCLWQLSHNWLVTILIVISVAL